MNLLKDQETAIPSGMSRRLFFKRASVATSAVALSGLLGMGAASGQELDADTKGDSAHGYLKKRDRDILVAAQIAEALAVTTYSNIINIAPFFTRIPSDDQGYLMAARQEEMSHYLLEQSVTDQFTPFTSFFYPHDMFADTQTTLNTLVTLEDAFIAAYRRAQLQHDAAAHNGGADHGHRKRSPHPRARDRSRCGCAGWRPD